MMARVPRCSGETTDCGYGTCRHMMSSADFKVDKNSTNSPLAFVDNDQRVMVAGSHLQVFDIASRRTVLDRQPVFYNSRSTYYALFGQYIAATSCGSDSYWIGFWNIAGYGVLYEYANGRIVRTFGSERPGISQKEASGQSAVGLGNDRFALAIEGGIKIVDMADQQWSNNGFHTSRLNFIDTLPDGRLVSVSDGGEVQFHRIGKADPLAQTQLYDGGDWLTHTPDGFFIGTKTGSEQLLTRIGFSTVYPIDSFFQALYRPDLVAEALKGDPDGKVKAAAAKLDLTKAIESGPAPKIAIGSPAEGTAIPADHVEVSATLTDQGGGIGKVEWRVNGLTLGIDSRGFDRLQAGTGGDSVATGQTVTVKKKLWLDPGDNKIEVVAYNAQGLIASEPATVTVSWDGETAATPPKLYVLAAGINDYWDGRLKLNYAASDARAIGQAFNAAGAKLFSSVEVDTLLDSQVTAEGLGKAFADLAGKVRPRDVFVFYLAGHGKTEDGRYYFIPQDFRYQDEARSPSPGSTRTSSRLGWRAFRHARACSSTTLVRAAR